MQNDTQFGDWEIWNGKGEPPTGLVQVQQASESRILAESTIRTFNAGAYCWDEIGRQNIIAFRRVIEPVLGNVVMTGHLKHFNAGGQMSNDTHRVAFPTIDGKLILGKYTGPDGAVVTVEVLG